MPIVFVVVGLVLGPHVLSWVSLSPTAELDKEFTELTLGLLLFADASTLPVRRVAREGGLEIRLLALGLPLSIAVGALIAFIIFPNEEVGLILLLGAALAPTDAALGLPIFNNPNIPSRIRVALNVESGLNDGIATPFVTLFITLAVAEFEGSRGWLRDAVGDIAIAVLVGAALGVAGGWLIRTALNKRWTTEQSAQLIFLFLAVASFYGARQLGGNGFIATFVGGLLCSLILKSAATSAAEFTETTGSAMSNLVWMLFGASFVPLALSDLFSWRAVIFAVLALTVMRMIPVAIAMYGTDLRPATIAIMGWFGPRGLASVVFLITAIVSFEEAHEATDTLIAAMTWTVLLSVVLHGLSATPLGRWYGNKLTSLPEAAPEFLHDRMDALVAESPAV